MGDDSNSNLSKRFKDIGSALESAKDELRDYSSLEDILLFLKNESEKGSNEYNCLYEHLNHLKFMLNNQDVISKIISSTINLDHIGIYLFEFTSILLENIFSNPRHKFNDGMKNIPGLYEALEKTKNIHNENSLKISKYLMLHTSTTSAIEGFNVEDVYEKALKTLHMHSIESIDYIIDNYKPYSYESIDNLMNLLSSNVVLQELKNNEIRDIYLKTLMVLHNVRINHDSDPEDYDEGEKISKDYIFNILSYCKDISIDARINYLTNIPYHIFHMYESGFNKFKESVAKLNNNAKNAFFLTYPVKYGVGNLGTALLRDKNVIDIANNTAIPKEFFRMLHYFNLVTRGEASDTTLINTLAEIKNNPNLQENSILNALCFLEEKTINPDPEWIKNFDKYYLSSPPYINKYPKYIANCIEFGNGLRDEDDMK